jgi:HSP20 family molecular chaperone IbpA
VNKSLVVTLKDFQRACDELFEDLVIERWRAGEQVTELEGALMVDKGRFYEARIAMRGADPRHTEVEVTEHRLRVRIPVGQSGYRERSFTLPSPIDRDTVSARWSKDTLVVTLPKQRGRRIEVR